MDKRLVLGLDIGITSVGWGIIDLTTGDIVDKGVRLFPEGTAAENVKRRQQRGARRLLRRRKQRINDLKDLLIKNGIINKDFVPLENPYKIRCKGLTGKLANDELATALLHIAKRRGSFIEFDKIEKDKSYTFEDYKTVIKNAGEVAGVVED
ncbi:MAG: type II CRISPR RNA-guided endonuclease Cas9, partial [Bacilli bacterium]|nr:type II CRISPR RNA-guided endonuclease Cas9 [Bacilli bacterium]